MIDPDVCGLGVSVCVMIMILNVLALDPKGAYSMLYEVLPVPFLMKDLL